MDSSPIPPDDSAEPPTTGKESESENQDATSGPASVAKATGAEQRKKKRGRTANATGAKPPHSQDDANPGARLVQVLGRKLVVILSVGSVILAVALCLLLGLFPSIQAAEASRFFLLLLISFLFGVFAFTLYPSNYRLDLSRGYQIPIVLVGPAALWIGLFIFFLNIFPKDKRIGVVFKPDANSRPIRSGSTLLLGWDQQPPAYYMIQNPKIGDVLSSGLIDGFYIQFDPSVKAYTLNIGIGASATNIDTRCKIVFRAGATSYSIEGTN
ncbi:MAG: hypothetical protein P4L46_03030 [Fimbriimonas sp.]|nr:hypothetical protein [Fimbriimonas sp.]